MGAKVIERAVAQGKLEGRAGKKQFEIFSADFIVDTHGGVWLFEFNMSPVLKDPKDAPNVNDADMIRGALSIVAPWEGGSPGLWDFAGEFVGSLVPPKAPAVPSSTAVAPPQASLANVTKPVVENVASAIANALGGMGDEEERRD